MARRRTEISRRHVRNGLGTEITAAIHQRGYELKRAGVQDITCRQELGMTVAQWNWLKHEGNTIFRSYDKLMMDEVRQLRTKSREGALALATGGVDAINLAVENSRAANAIQQGILRHMAADICSIGEPNGKRDVEACMPTPHVLNTMKVLQRIGDLTPAADAFMKIFGDVALHKGLYPERDAPSTHEQSGEPLLALQGDDAEREAFISEDGMTEVVDGLREMSPEELRAFAEGGDEIIVVDSNTPVQ